MRHIKSRPKKHATPSAAGSIAHDLALGRSTTGRLFIASIESTRSQRRFSGQQEFRRSKRSDIDQHDDDDPDVRAPAEPAMVSYKRQYSAEILSTLNLSAFA